jgi:hypothetical protein
LIFIFIGIPIKSRQSAIKGFKIIELLTNIQHGIYVAKCYKPKITKNWKYYLDVFQLCYILLKVSSKNYMPN